MGWTANKDLAAELRHAPPLSSSTELHAAITPVARAAAAIQRLARTGISLCLLSNARCNTLTSLGGLQDFFTQELSLLSYQHSGTQQPRRQRPRLHHPQLIQPPLSAVRCSEVAITE